MKNNKLLLIAGLFLFSSVNAIAAESGKKDYYDDFYDREGNVLFKLRGFYGHTDGKITGLPSTSRNNASASKKKLAEHSYGFDSAMNIFVTDNIAAEISLGLGYLKTKSAALEAVLRDYGTTTSFNQKRHQIIYVPLTITGQFHTAPFGGIRPYVGAGYSATYMYTRSRAIKTYSALGPVLQAGVDFMAKDDTIFTFDVKQYFLKSKVDFKKGFLGTTNDIKAKVTWNPLVVSAGIGFKF